MNSIDDLNEKILIREYQKPDYLQMMKLWNDEVGFIYPLTKEICLQKVNDSKYLDIDNSYVAFENKKMVGFIITKTYDGNPIIQKYCDKGWISLFFVSRKYRRMGIGNTFLDKVEKKMKDKGISTILVGSDMDNFFPGIPHDFDNLSDSFFKSHGYNVGNYTHDLTKKLTKRELTNYQEFIKQNDLLSRYSIRYANRDDKEALLDFLKNCFYGRWYYEALEYFEKDDIEKEYLIVLDKERVVGFLRVNNQLIRTISYNIIWAKRFRRLVGYGPLGVDPEYRKQGLAKLLILNALSDNYQRGYSNALIDWTGLVTYYQRFGFEVWKCYRYTQKDISKTL